MNKLLGAISSRDALHILIECPWALKGQWKIFQEGKLAPTDSPLTTETCLQTIRLLAGQLTVFTDSSATAGTRDCGAGVIVTCGNPADPTIHHRSHIYGTAFTSSFAEEAAAMQLALEWTTTKHPDHLPTICTDSQSLLKAIERRSSVTQHKRSFLNARPGTPVGTRAQRNPWQRARRHRSQNSRYNHQRSSLAHFLCIREIPQP